MKFDTLQKIYLTDLQKKKRSAQSKQEENDMEAAIQELLELQGCSNDMLSQASIHDSRNPIVDRLTECHML